MSQPIALSAGLALFRSEPKGVLMNITTRTVMARTTLKIAGNASDETAQNVEIRTDEAPRPRIAMLGHFCPPVGRDDEIRVPRGVRGIMFDTSGAYVCCR